MKVIVYDRTSTDEGQDADAGALQARATCEARGWEVTGRCVDPDVPGDTEPGDRPGWKGVLAQTRPGDASRVIVVREFSRFSRAEPTRALARLAELESSGRRLVSLAEPHCFGLETDPGDPTTVLLRFIAAWSGWREKANAKRRTGEAMREITSGRRKTKTGKPPGRPPKALTPAEALFCRGRLEAGEPLTQVHEALLTERGYYMFTDREARKKRFISRERLRQIMQPGLGA